LARQPTLTTQVSATSLRPNSRCPVGMGGHGRYPSWHPCFVTKLAVPGRTDLASADAGRTRCHSREDCGVYSSSRAVTEKRRVENDKGLTCT
jgi:hypothetical protein